MIGIKSILPVSRPAFFSVCVINSSTTRIWLLFSTLGNTAPCSHAPTQTARSVALRRVETVNPYVKQAAAVQPAGERAYHERSGGFFFGYCDGVLQIQADRVGACLKYFFHPTGVVARGKEKTADCRLLCGWFYY